MKTNQVISSNIGDFDPKEWNWLYCSKTESRAEGGAPFPVDEDWDEAAKLYGVPKELLQDIQDAFVFLAETLQENMHKDLKDIWNKLPSQKK